MKNADSRRTNCHRTCRGARRNRSAGLLAGLLAAAVCGCGRVAPVAGSAAEARRIVSLAPNLTEMVCAVGAADRLAGRTSACDYPPDAVAGVEVVGGFGVPSLEKLLAVKPDLILDVDLEDEAAGRRMQAAGLRRERIRCRTLDDVPRAIERVGLLAGRRTEARALAEGLRVRLAEFRASAPPAEQCPSVFIEVWHDPPTTAGGDSFLSEMVELAGGRNIARDVSKAYVTVSAEWVVTRNPDVILCFYMSPQGSVRDFVLRRTGWRGVNAVRSGRVYDGFDNSVVLRPGPRFPAGVSAIRARLLERRAPDGSTPP